MSKYVVTIQFEWNEKAMQIIPEHRSYINDLIDDLARGLKASQRAPKGA